jgi:hypothetical protein
MRRAASSFPVWLPLWLPLLVGGCVDLDALSALWDAGGAQDSAVSGAHDLAVIVDQDRVADATRDLVEGVDLAGPASVDAASSMDLACGRELGCQAAKCAPGMTQPCYDGPPNTLGKGICHGGTQQCINGHWAMACNGEQLPEAEHCDDGRDHDCNGLAGCQDPACLLDPHCQAGAPDLPGPHDLATAADMAVPSDLTAPADLATCVGVCAPGTTRQVPCGNCGLETDTCDNTCQWRPGACNGQGVCSPNSQIVAPCGNCGSATSTCNQSCQWVVGACTGEGVCSPGEMQQGGCDKCSHQTCTNNCQWDSCALNPGSACEFRNGNNSRPCACGGVCIGTPKQWCLASCQWAAACSCCTQLGCGNC